jgi:glycosyltransferase involved in cell wall biosynthesis
LRATTLDIGVFGGRGIPSTYGGFETFLSLLLPELARRGHDVTAYCRKGEVEDHAGSWRGVRQVFVPSMSTKQLGTLTHGFAAVAASLVHHHDVVLAVNTANAPACLLARALGLRIALNVDGQEWLRGKWSRAGRGYYRAAAHLVRWASAAPISDCQAMADVYRDSFDVDTTVIPYFWTELDEAAGAPALEQLSLRAGGYVACGGRLVPENNIDRVANAYIATSNPDPLVVMGRANYDSPVVRNLRAMAREDPRVRLIGHVADRAAYGALVANAGFYVHAHSVGGMNPALVEAMGVGADIVALDTPFNREVLAGSGRYFASFESDLPRLLADPDPGLGDRRRDLARLRARHTYGVASVVDAYESLLLHLACTRARSHLTATQEWPRAIPSGTAA